MKRKLKKNNFQSCLFLGKVTSKYTIPTSFPSHTHLMCSQSRSLVEQVTVTVFCYTGRLDMAHHFTFFTIHVLGKATCTTSAHMYTSYSNSSTFGITIINIETLFNNDIWRFCDTTLTPDQWNSHTLWRTMKLLN